MMYKKTFYLLVFLFTAYLFNACVPEEDNFDETLLVGKWNSGTVYYKYLANGGGATWDTSDDVSEDEAQKFTWTLIKSELKQIHIMETGGIGVPKVYTLTELTSTTLKYRDNLGSKSYTFTKVK